MRVHDGLDTKQLLHKLRRDLDSEEHWKQLILPISDSNGSLSLGERNSTARWLLAVNTSFGFYPETYVLAVSLMDDFFKSVKVAARYVRCIGLTCMLIAAKLQQENEAVPTIQQLVEGSGASFTASDVRRMEVVLLNKLGWSPNRVTSLTYLHIFHALLLRSFPEMSEAARKLSPRDPEGASRLLESMLNITASPLAARYSPCSLALALLSLQAAAWQPNTWVSAMLSLVALTKKCPRSLVECREVVARQPWLNFISRPICRPTRPLGIPRASVSPSPRLKDIPRATPKRKAHNDDMEDDVYECIKRMYGDEDSLSSNPAPVQA